MKNGWPENRTRIWVSGNPTQKWSNFHQNDYEITGYFESKLGVITNLALISREMKIKLFHSNNLIIKIQCYLFIQLNVIKQTRYVSLPFNNDLFLVDRTSRDRFYDVIVWIKIKLCVIAK